MTFKLSIEEQLQLEDIVVAIHEGFCCVIFEDAWVGEADDDTTALKILAEYQGEHRAVVDKFFQVRACRKLTE